MNSKFYNKMPFAVPFRQIWLRGSPSVELPSGAIIEGPTELLTQYSFLAPIPIDFHRVESMTQSSNFEFRDEMIQPDDTKIEVVNGPDEPEKIQKEIEEEIEKIEKNVVIDVSDKSESTELTDTTKLSFDPKTVNWLTVKTPELENAAKKMNINIDHLKDMKPKERRWELVRLIKKTQ